MKKIIIILSIFALIAGGCENKKTPNDAVSVNDGLSESPTEKVEKKQSSTRKVKHLFQAHGNNYC